MLQSFLSKMRFLIKISVIYIQSDYLFFISPTYFSQQCDVSTHLHQICQECVFLLAIIKAITAAAMTYIFNL